MKSDEMMRCPKCCKAMIQEIIVQGGRHTYQIMQHANDYDSSECKVDHVRIVWKEGK